MTTAKPPQDEVKIEKFERNLLVKLTAEEKAQLAERGAHLFGEIEQKIEDSKASGKQAKAQIEELKAEHKRVNTEYRDGAKYQKVPCERRLNYRLGEVEEVRKDNGERISVRPMNASERQRELPLEGEAAADGDDIVVPDGYTGDEDDDNDPPPLPTQKKTKKKGARAGATPAE
jgi:hypothetical protein